MRCANHPQQPAIGLCVDCGALVCAACVTRLQGRNVCPDCLQGRAAAGRDDRGGRVRTATVLMGLWAGVSFVGFVALLWVAGLLVYSFS